MAGYLDSASLEARYLLGELSGEEEKSFETRYFANDQAFEELQIAEGEVIDAYVSERLPAQARKHLEQQLEKSPRLRQRVAFARTFAGAIPDIRLEELPGASAERPSPRLETPVLPQPTYQRRRSWLDNLFWDSFKRPALTLVMVACVFVVSLGSWAVVSVRLRRESQQLADERAAIARQREELNRLSAEQDHKIERMTADLKAQQSRTAEELARLEESRKRLKQIEEEGRGQQKAVTQTMAMLVLSAGSLRGGSPAEVKIPPGASHLPLGLVLEAADYPRYNVVITDVRQKEVFKKTGLGLRAGKTLFVRVPATRLKPDSYSVDVSGATSSGPEHIRTFQFRVIPN